MMRVLLSIALITAAFMVLPTSQGAPIADDELMQTVVANSVPEAPPTTSEIAVPIECIKCTKTADCGSDLECYQAQCIKTGTLKEKSIAKCFPNLKECAMCTEDAQCRSGKCSYSHCVTPEHLEKSLKLCGVDTGVSDDVPKHGDPYGYETGKVEYDFSDGYTSSSFGGYHHYNYYR